MDKTKPTNLVFGVTAQAERNVKAEQTAQLS